MAIGMPGWPLLAFCTASIDSVRMVSMHRRSISTFGVCSVALMRGGYPRCAGASVPPVRTPDERFAGLPAFPWQPRHREWEGLRLAHLDEGGGAPVWLVHGEPTWSFL